jgi:hypothetical protein
VNDHHPFDLLYLDYFTLWRTSLPHHSFTTSLSEHQWEIYLKKLDSAGMIFHFLLKLRQRGDFDKIPDRVQVRLTKNLQDQTDRHVLISREFLEWNRLLQEEKIRYICLKGLTVFPDFVDDSIHHIQSDHDFLVHPVDLKRANAAFLGLGFEALDSHSGLSVDHLPTLIKSSGWQWKGNFYDPEIPRAIELHFRLWDAEFEGISINSLEGVWQDLIVREVSGIRIPVLSRQDALTYAVMHAFRHLLRNDLRLSHLYELAFFLNRSATDISFWNTFGEKLKQCATSLKVAAAMFQLARHCFEPEVSPFVHELVARHLTLASQLWIKKYGRREALSSYRQSKSGLFLQITFASTRREGWSKIRKKLLPQHLPPKYLGIKIPEGQKTTLQRSREAFHFLGQICKRSIFHACSLLVFVIRLPLWNLSVSRLQGQPEEIRLQQSKGKVGAEGGT